MSRHRWFNAKWPLTMWALAERLKNRPYGEKYSDGFILDRVRNDYIEARYIERIEYIDKVKDPFGKEFAFERVSFNLCEFRASSSSLGLEILNAPRKTQGLVSRLLETNDYSLAISPLSVNLLTWASTFQELANIKAVVESIQIGNLELARGVLAKAVIKGDKDVRNISAMLTEGRSYNLEKVLLRIEGNHEGTVLLTNNGAVKVDVKHADSIVIALRNSLSSTGNTSGSVK